MENKKVYRPGKLFSNFDSLVHSRVIVSALSGSQGSIGRRGEVSVGMGITRNANRFLMFSAWRGVPCPESLRIRCSNRCR
jgi:hypothetical protein